MKHGFTLAEVLITLGIIGVVAALSAPSLVQNASSAQVGPKLAKAISTFETANENLLQEASATRIANSGATEGSGNDIQQNYIVNLSKYMKIAYLNEGEGSSKYASMIKNYNGSAIKNPGDANSNSNSNGGLSDKVSSSGLKLIDTVGLKTDEAVKHLGLTKDGMLFAIALNTTPDGLVSANVSASLPGGVNNKGDAVSSNSNAANDVSPAHQTQYGTVLIDINGKVKPNRIGKDAFLFRMMADGTLQPYGAGGAWNTGTDKCNASEVTTGDTCGASILENDRKVIY